MQTLESRQYTEMTTAQLAPLYISSADQNIYIDTNVESFLFILLETPSKNKK